MTKCSGTPHIASKSSIVVYLDDAIVVYLDFETTGLDVMEHNISK